MADTDAVDAGISVDATLRDDAVSADSHILCILNNESAEYNCTGLQIDIGV